jgi:hypothetical protein
MAMIIDYTIGYGYNLWDMHTGMHSGMYVSGYLEGI